MRRAREDNHKQLFITSLKLFKLRLIESRFADVAHMCAMFTGHVVDQQQDILIINTYLRIKQYFVLYRDMVLAMPLRFTDINSFTEFNCTR